MILAFPPREDNVVSKLFTIAIWFVCVQQKANRKKIKDSREEKPQLFFFFFPVCMLIKVM